MPTAGSKAEKAAKGVEGKTVKLIRQASNTGQLYGSVSARDIVEALEGEGAHVAKSQIVLARPIKAIGVHEVKVVLHPEVATTVKVNVARSPEEADLQAQGVDVMAEMFERDTAAFIEDVVPGSAAEDAPAEADAAPAAEAAEAVEAEVEVEAPAETAEAPAETAEAPAETAEAPAAEDGEAKAD